MSRGFFAGVAWGSVVAGLGLVTASQLAGVPERHASADIPAATTTQVIDPPAESPNPDPALPVVVPSIEPQGKMAVIPTEPQSEQPVVVATPIPGDAPEAPVMSTPGVPTDVTKPVELVQPDKSELPKPDVQTAAPAAEVNDTKSEGRLLVPSTESAPKVAPSPSLVMAEVKPDQPLPSSEIAGSPEAQQAVPMPASPAPEQPVPSLANQPSTTAISKRTEPELPSQSAIDAGPGAADLPPLPPLSEEETAIIEAAGSVGPESESIQKEPVVVADPPVATIEPEVVAPAEVDMAQAPSVRPTPGFGGNVAGVKTNRLPRIGGPEPTPASEPETEQSPDAEVANEESAPTIEAPDENLPPIERFAREFENPAAKPLFAILLWDDGSSTVDRAALADLPFPVNFVIDPAMPKAAEMAAIYRKKGQEVVMLASSLPLGATASDLAVAFEAHAQALPEAVAVVDMEQGGFQSNRNLAAQVLAVVEDQGRGILSWDRGLNAASQIARREGIRNATIYRKIDGSAEASATIQRYLDRAAFKAAQDGRVVVAGHARSETVAALLEWAVEGRAATVAIAPITAVLVSQ